MAQFGEMLAELRKDKKLTQNELAKRLHVSAGTISNYENGVYFPDLEKLLNLADLFGVTTDYLLGRCTFSGSPKIFDRKITDAKTVGQFITELQALPEDRRQAIVMIVGDMSSCAAPSQGPAGEPT